ncbi:MAG: hypothetical protein HYV13_03995 [Candidatus Doudnabacteria bacterium]|nr:hypothetical protein [Candidatus Doudnabacteria bacterium]
MAYYWEKAEMQKRGEVALNRWIIPTGKMKILWKKYWDNVLNLRKFKREISHVTNFKNIEQLRPYVEKFYRYLIQLWVYALVQELANFASPEYLSRKLRGLVPASEMEETVGILMASPKPSFHQQSELELLQTALAAKNKKGLRAKLKVYASKWYWVENSYYTAQILPDTYFLRQVSRLSKQQLKEKIQNILASRREIAKRKRQVIKKYHVPKSLVAAARNISFSIWWQDHRKATSWRAHNVIDRFNKFASPVFGLSIDQLMYYDCAEWLRLFQTGAKVSPRVLKHRKNSTMILVTPKDYRFFYGKKVKDFLKALESKKEINAGKEVQGIVAFNSGQKVSGRTRILHSPKFAQYMKPGEILVAPMTSPDYIVAMRKAKAIVTDVGGLMSHAAVVSRELGVPCIVGTKIATKVLKDGDLVEVDASKGIVRKVGR